MDGYDQRRHRQLRDLFGSMTPAARITTTLLLVAVIVSVLYLFRMSAGGPDEYLLGGRPLSPSEMAAAEAAFAQAGLSDYEIDRTRIRIARGQKAVYIGAMAEGNALPPDFNVYLDEAINSGGPFDSRDQREARLKNARQKELALIIRSMRDIESATVQFDVVDKGGFPPKKEYTAMVAVKPTGSEELSEESVRSIRHLVSSAIAGLTSGGVTVSDLNTGRAFPGGDSLGPGAEENNAYAMAKRTYEQELMSKVKNRLSYIKGATFAVNVELNPEMDAREYSTKYDTQPVAGITRDWTREETSTAESSGGRPGPAAQQPNQPAVIRQPSSESSVTESENEAQNMVGAGHVVKSKASLVPDRATVSIGVPSTWYEEIWRRKRDQEGDPAGPDEHPKVADIEAIEAMEVKRIQDAIVPLIPPVDAAKSPHPLVTVMTFSPPIPQLEEDEATSMSVLSWLAQNWQTLGMMLMGGVGLLFVRSMVRGAIGTTTARREEEGDEGLGAATKEALSAANDDDDDDGPSPSLRPGFEEDGPNLREELKSLVKKDPDAAANILKHWIGGAT